MIYFLECPFLYHFFLENSRSERVKDSPANNAKTKQKYLDEEKCGLENKHSFPNCVAQLEEMANVVGLLISTDCWEQSRLRRQ